MLQENTTYTSCLSKQNSLIETFTDCRTNESKYQKIISFGRLLPEAPDSIKIPENLVSGCQSTLYLASGLENGKVIFQIHSDALIASGLAALLLYTYNGEPPEVVLGCEPQFIQKIGLHESLTPGRSNGLLSLRLKMKQEVIKFLVRR